MRQIVSVVGVLLLIGLTVGASGLRPAPLRTVEAYERKCSSCHGKEGALLERGFEKKYASESELREVVASMPGAIGLRREELDTMIAYMRAISRGEPFLVWTAHRENALEGEVSPSAAQVRAAVGRKALKVARPEPNRWRVELPRGVRLDDIEIIAQSGKVRTTLRLKDAPYSHTR
ncbi:MAG: cytochrome c [Armatimonadota bacterium]|nr:cytochrome c [Armatimonadota bacterium]